MTPTNDQQSPRNGSSGRRFVYNVLLSPEAGGQKTTTTKNEEGLEWRRRLSTCGHDGRSHDFQGYQHYQPTVMIRLRRGLGKAVHQTYVRLSWA